MASEASKTSTWWPRTAAASAKARPATPAPITATRCGVAAGRGVNSSSRPATGLTRQDTFLLAKVWSRQAWLQAMQVLISSARPSRALSTKSGSASIWRASDTMSACPEARMSSATPGSLMRFDAHTGTSTAAFRRPESSANAARGTEVTMVGTRASCQPIPVLSRSTPASTRRPASSSVSSHVCPSATRSCSEMRYCSMKSSPTSARMRRTISIGSDMRRRAEPPHSSVRRLVARARNWLSR